jgi:FtsP/CotA-like multicopper oxidase with cupredoxin domain
MQPSDDVLDTVVAPMSEYTYTYKIPANHMPGTFWYHPHLHGSVAIQTAGGAAGVLIIEDAEDTLPREISCMEEQVILLQTVPFAALRGLSQYSGDDLFHAIRARLPSGWENFTTENNQRGEATAIAPGNWSLIDNFALVNGEYHPRLKVKEGEWYRWRIVHGGPFFFMDLTAEAFEYEGGTASSTASDSCKCELQLLAKDGIYLMQAPRLVHRIVLPPAGRADIAIRCSCRDADSSSDSHKLRLVSGAHPGSSGAWNGDMYWNPLIATIEIKPSTAETEEVLAVDDEPLPTFEVHRPSYLRDLRTMPAESVEGEFKLEFADAAVVVNTPAPGGHKAPAKYPLNGDDSGTCTFNGMSFNRSTPLGTMKLDALQEWTVAGVKGHPLHIHVNPFQVNSVYSFDQHAHCTTYYTLHVPIYIQLQLFVCSI